jgi:hypothetical protein
MELHPSSQHSDTTVHTDNSLSDMEKATILQRLGVSDSNNDDMTSIPGTDAHV